VASLEERGYPYKIQLPPNVIPDNLLNDLWVWEGDEMDSGQPADVHK